MNPSRFLFAAATLVAASSAFAAPATALKTGTPGTTELADGSANVWSGGAGANGSPALGDIVTWNGTSLVGSQTVSNDVTWNSMTFSSLTGALNIGGTGVITLNGGSSGSTALVANNSTGTAVTISNTIKATYGAGAAVAVGTGGTNRLQLTGDQGALILTGNVTANGTATANDVNLWLRGGNAGNRIDGTLVVDGQLAKGDGGTWTLNGTNTIGFVYFNNGTLLAGSNQAFGKGTIYLSDNGILSSPVLASKDSTARSYSNSLDLTGGFSTGSPTAIFGQSTGGTGAQSFSGLVTLGTAVRKITTNTDTTFSNIVSGVGGGITKLGTATLTLSGANNYTGGTNINAGTLVTGNTSALGTGAGTVAVTGTGTTLQIGAGGVTLGSGALLTVAAGSILKFTGATSVIALSNGYTLTGNAIIDLNGGFAGNLNQTYNLITGAGTKDDGLVLVQNGAAGYNYTFSQGVLTITAVPEPSTYGLIGAGALAAVAMVRRRRKVAAVA